jgi:lipopolysaccharide/colanic/teichoic acid biosynthesis glycosyltransferase
MLKRLMDIAGALAGLLLLSPFILGTAVAVWISMGRPLLFRQERPGLAGRPFGMIKFRTMADRRDEQGVMLKDEFRLTRVGRFLRATSLDELPGLWNVLKGDMSLVGPRPLLMRYLLRYTPEQMRRHEVKPGVTGWAQVNGRNAISWEDKFALDVWYVDHRSLPLDLKILCLTVLRVVKRQDVNVDAVGTMPEFFGSDDRARPGRS